MNLLEETRRAMINANQTPNKIKFIGSASSGYCCAWYEFCIMANKEYDSGYGSQQVAEDLVILFSDRSYLERVEYDGSESWSYVKPFKIPLKKKKISKLFCSDAGEIGWKNLEDLNK